MSVDQQLQPGEEILYRAQTTRISLIPRAALTVLAVAGALVAWHAGPSWQPLAVALGAIAVVLAVWTFWRLLLLRSNEYVLTTHRLIQQSGFLAKRSMDIRLDKINNVEHRQTLWGRILGFGDLEIDTASENGAGLFPHINHPLDFKRAILAAVEDYRTRVFRPQAVQPSLPPPVQAAPAPALPPAERIRQLKKLLDEGLITAQEFEAKRRQALEEM
jgi:membrane protein YdbS with pleckstrin-like domain